MLNFNDLKEYFEKFFKDYGPYRSNKVYSIIIDNILNKYWDHAYNKTPNTFKLAFEQQSIPVEFYDNILLSVGFTKDILHKISWKDKEILLKAFTDFNIFKGTLNQIQKISANFEEEINLYELFIDFRTILIPFYSLTFFNNQNYVIAENDIIYDSIRVNDYLETPQGSYRVVVKKEDYKIYIDKPFIIDSDILELKLNNINIQRWVFVPDLIYSGEKVKDQVLTTFLDYERIYNDTKKYFISIEYLESIRNELLLPIKSNLIFIDYKKFRDINLLNYLFAAIVLKEHRKDRIVIYFKDGNYSTNLERIYKLWYYVVFKYFNKGISVSGLPDPALIFSIDSPFFNLKISDIEIIKEEYNQLKTIIDVSKFYNKYFTSSFYPLKINEVELSIEEFSLLMENEIGSELIEYVNSRIKSKFESSFILDELYFSVVTWSYINDFQYIHYLIDSLSYISTNIETSPTYNLIMFVKPYHTLLVKELGEISRIKNNFNLTNPDHQYEFLMKFFVASVLNISHSLFGSEIILQSNDSSFAISNSKLNLILNAKSIINLLESYDLSLIKSDESVSFENHIHLINIRKIINSFMLIINEQQQLIDFKNLTNYQIISHLIKLFDELFITRQLTKVVFDEIKKFYISFKNQELIGNEYNQLNLILKDSDNILIDHMINIIDNVFITIQTTKIDIDDLIKILIEFKLEYNKFDNKSILNLIITKLNKIHIISNITKSYLTLFHIDSDIFLFDSKNLDLKLTNNSFLNIVSIISKNLDLTLSDVDSDVFLYNLKNLDLKLSDADSDVFLYNSKNLDLKLSDADSDVFLYNSKNLDLIKKNTNHCSIDSNNINFIII